MRNTPIVTTTTVVLAFHHHRRFDEPLDVLALPHYLGIVRTPLDLGTIAKRHAAREYDLLDDAAEPARAPSSAARGAKAARKTATTTAAAPAPLLAQGAAVHANYQHKGVWWPGVVARVHPKPPAHRGGCGEGGRGGGGRGDGGRGGMRPSACTSYYDIEYEDGHVEEHVSERDVRPGAGRGGAVGLAIDVRVGHRVPPMPAHTTVTSWLAATAHAWAILTPPRPPNLSLSLSLALALLGAHRVPQLPALQCRGVGDLSHGRDARGLVYS